MEYVTYYAVRSDDDKPEQRKAMKAFCANNDGKSKRTFTEEYGPGMKQWPVLQDAVDYCQARGLPLIIARIGRLRQNPTLMTILAQSGVEFACTDDDKVNSATIQILSAFAQEQAVKRSHKTKEAVEQLRSEGVKLGGARDGGWTGDKKNILAGPKAAAERRRQRSADYYQFVLPRAAQMRRDGMKYNDIAKVFNEEGLVTQGGKPYNEVSINRLLARAKEQGINV